VPCSSMCLTYKVPTYCKEHDNIQQAQNNAKIDRASFIALQVRDLEASKTFYVEQIGLTASPHNPPGAVVFNTKPVPFAIRTPMVDLDATSKLGWGVSLWIAATDADALHAQLVEKGVPILSLLPMTVWEILRLP